jgi:SulP family sulfate permease
MTTTLKTLRPNRATFRADAAAGFTFAVVNIPQAMANALLATVNPVLGLYTLMIATPIGAIFTSSVYMNVSTTSALSVATGDALAGIPDTAKASNVAVLVLLVGILQLLAGLFRLGSFIRFVSKSVMVGFTTGVALLIILGQVDDLTGYTSRFSGKILQLADTILHLQQADYATLAIGLLTMGLILGIGRTRLNKAAFIIALFTATLVTYLFNLETVATVGQIATIPDSLRNFNLPSLVLVPDLVASAVAIAIIGLVQSAGVSQSYPNPDGKFPDVSGDFRGQGLANIATSFFQGIPGGGSMSGTSLVVNTGMQSRWANILAGLFIVPLVLLFKNVIGLVPMPALAGLLIVVGYQSLNLKDIEIVRQTSQVSRVAMALTLVATLTLPLQFAVFVGVAVSILMYVFQSSNQVRLAQLIMTPHGFPIETAVTPALHDREVVVLLAYGSLFFAAASVLETQLPEVNKAREAAVIFILRGRDDVGSTLITVLDRYARSLQAGNGRLLLTEVDEKVVDQLRRTGLLRLLGEENVYPAQPQIGVSLNLALDSVSAWLDGLRESVSSK